MDNNHHFEQTSQSADYATGVTVSSAPHNSARVEKLLGLMAEWECPEGAENIEQRAGATIANCVSAKA
ncbi:MAG TPA: hypothetical protein VFG49_01625 [Dyella sp.]|uniref:hypothetical protein n=1 Tax=Dyella sp. TaxID=1869338 RepID=UPI002D797E97|nr:hypothetical protein [Dyella sp.]HET6552211.1 hypothetical protein [Dyella sp.]